MLFRSTHEPIEPKRLLTADDIQAARDGVAGMAVVKELEGSGILDAKYGLTLNAETIINVFVLPEEGVTILSPDPVATQTISGERYYRFDTEKIGAGNLSKVYDIAVTTTEGVAHVKVSAMSYVYAQLNSASIRTFRRKAMI